MKQKDLVYIYGAHWNMRAGDKIIGQQANLTDKSRCYCYCCLDIPAHLPLKLPTNLRAEWCASFK